MHAQPSFVVHSSRGATTNRSFDELPKNYSFGWLCAKQSQPSNLVVVPHTVTDTELASVTLKLWRLPTPKSVVQIVGLSTTRTYNPNDMALVKVGLLRSILKKEQAWFVCDGAQNPISSMLSSIREEPGFDFRDDLFMIGIQDQAGNLLDTQTDRPHNLGVLANDSSIANPQLSHHLIVNVEHSYEGYELIPRKLDRLFRVLQCAYGLVAIEGSDDSDVGLVLRELRRGNTVVVITGQSRAKQHTIGSAFQLFLRHKNNPLRAVQQSLVKLRPARRSTHANLRLTHETEMTRLNNMVSMHDEWSAFASQNPELAEVVSSDLIHVVYIHETNALQKLREISPLIENPPPPIVVAKDQLEVQPVMVDCNFTTGLFTQLDGTVVPFADLNTPCLNAVNKDEFENLTTAVWGMTPPHSFTCVIGSLPATNTSLNLRIEPHFFNGITRFASRSGGWVLCSGLEHQVEKILGKCVESMANPPPVVGICSWESFSQRTTKVNDHMVEIHVSNSEPLNQAATQMLLLRGQAWESEDPQARIVNTICSWYTHSIPIFVMLVGGDRTTRLDLRVAVEQSIPVFVLEGTGGFADSVAELVRLVDEDGDISTFRNAYQMEPELIQLICRHTAATAPFSPVFVVDIDTVSPVTLGKHVQRLFDSQTTLSLVGTDMGDKGCWAVSRNISTLNIPENIKRFFERTEHGRIRSNQTKVDSIVPYIVMDKGDKLDVRSVLLNAWNLLTPNIIFSVTGKAAGDWDTPEMGEKIVSLLGGVVSAAAKTRAWLVSGGSNVGCMQALGQAVANSDTIGQVPTIAVCTKGKVGGHAAFSKKGKDISAQLVFETFKRQASQIPIAQVVRWSKLSNESMLEQSLVELGIITGCDVLILSEHEFCTKCVSADISEHDASKIFRAFHYNFQSMEPNHTHMILVKGDTWGDEVSVRINVEDTIVDKKILVVVGGGPNTWRTVLSAVRAKPVIPILVFDKVAGVSSQIARGMQTRELDSILRSETDLESNANHEHTQYVHEIIKDSDDGRLIRVVDPDIDTPKDVERKIFELTNQLHIPISHTTYNGNANIVLPLHVAMLQHLDLANNNITDHGVKLLARYLEHNTSLVDIDLSDNKIGDVGAVALAKALVRNRTLSLLILTGNAITTRGQNILSSVVFSRLLPCEFSRNHALHPFGSDRALQQLASSVIYSKWLSVVGTEVQNDKTIPVHTPELMLQLLAWPLHTCVRYPQTLRVLLEEFVAITDTGKYRALAFVKDVPDFTGRTLLHVAVEDGHYESLHMMLNLPGFVPTAQLATTNDFQLTVYQRALLQLKVSQAEVQKLKNAADQKLSTAADNKLRVDNRTAADLIQEEEAVHRAGSHLVVAQAIENTLSQHRYITHIRQRFSVLNFVWSFGLYIVFLFLATVAVLNTCKGWDQTLFRLRAAVVDAVLEEVASIPAETSDDGLMCTCAQAKKFSDIGNLDDIWQWIDGPFVDAFWPDEKLENDFYMLAENRVVGAVRLRQQRVGERSCDSNSKLQDLDFLGDKCFPQYSSSHRSTTDAPRVDLSDFALENDGLHWKTPSQLGYKSGFNTRSPAGFERYWDGSGFAIDIPSGNQTAALEIVSRIKAANWIDRQTRALFVESLLFNPNLQTFVWFSAGIETLPTAGSIPFSSVIALAGKSTVGSGGAGLAFLFAEILFFLLAARFFVEAALNLRDDIDRKSYRTILLSIPRALRAHLSAHFVAFPVLLAGLYYRLKNVELLDDLHTEIGHYDLVANVNATGRFHFVDAGFLARNTMQQYTWYSASLTFYWLNLLRCFILVPFIGPVVAAIVRTMLNVRVVIFAWVLLLVVLAFMFGFFVAFSQLVPSFQSFTTSGIQTGLTTLGEHSLDDLTDVGPVYGPVLFFFLVFVAGLVMLNIFIAVVSDVYGFELKNSEVNWHNMVTNMMAIDASGDSYKPLKNLFGKQARPREAVVIKWDANVLARFEAAQAANKPAA